MLNYSVVSLQIEQRDMAAAETLRAAFTKVIFLINIMSVVPRSNMLER